MFLTGEQCPVCLKEYTVGETVKVMPCKHSFHSSCILPWLERVSNTTVCHMFEVLRHMHILHQGVS